MPFLSSNAASNARFTSAHSGAPALHSCFVEVVDTVTPVLHVLTVLSSALASHEVVTLPAGTPVARRTRTSARSGARAAKSMYPRFATQAHAPAASVRCIAASSAVKRRTRRIILDARTGWNSYILSHTRVPNFYVERSNLLGARRATLGSMTPDRLLFWSRSPDGRAPGSGTGELVADAAAYAELATVPHWRRVLSNFWETAHPIDDGDGRLYRTVEHGFQAHKIALADAAAARRFEADSGDPIGEGGGLTAQKNRKLVKLGAVAIAEWDAASWEDMHQLHLCKFGQDELSRFVLAATGDAELWHIVPRRKPERWSHLEVVRALVQAGRV